MLQMEILGENYMHRLDSGAAANNTRTGTHLHLAILHGAAL
jgi:hypothetical protein